MSKGLGSPHLVCWSMIEHLTTRSFFRLLSLAHSSNHVHSSISLNQSLTCLPNCSPNCSLCSISCSFVCSFFHLPLHFMTPLGCLFMAVTYILASIQSVIHSLVCSFASLSSKAFVQGTLLSFHSFCFPFNVLPCTSINHISYLLL